MFKRKSYLLLVLLGVILYWSKTRIVANSFNEEIKLDNSYIQTYQELNGRWVLPFELKKSFKDLIAQYGTNETEIKIVNGLPQDKDISLNVALFLPFHDSYINKIIESGNGREIIYTHKKELLWPVAYKKSFIFSAFGRRERDVHSGIDIVCPVGTLILAAEDGKVVSAQFSGNYGNAILLNHGNEGLQTLYAHNSLLLVKEGDKVKKGQAIAFSGVSGESTGPHLHFEVRNDNVVLNPEHYISSTKPSLVRLAKLEDF
ncbi:MAG: M23 family metallopeptidase [Leptospiraceae bacterium]|nr:M23 family metallopeptidase [Leptospiraceae bacterium]MCP5497104.1 M23 family metallopeptidase [Leptospiraceae bacterium]